MATEFKTLRRLYDEDQFQELLKNPDGIYWLKLRSISRTEILRELCEKAKIENYNIPVKSLFNHVYDKRPDEKVIDELINETYKEERNLRRANEDYLISQLYQMKVFDWGGLYQNSLEQTIVNNYVKKLQSWAELNKAIENELYSSMRGYAQCSWYNHWTSIVIEDIFKDHKSVLPTIGLVKKIDFFINGFPFDLKVTYFPDGFMKELRSEEGIKQEFSEIKSFCKKEGIWFDKEKTEGELFPELLAKVIEHHSKNAGEFLQEFKQTRERLIRKTINDPTRLKIWLYENQGVRRFDAANRFFLVLIDMDNLEESWKLKRNRKLLVDEINPHLDKIKTQGVEQMKINFDWEDNKYETYAETLFIIA